MTARAASITPATTGDPAGTLLANDAIPEEAGLVVEDGLVEEDLLVEDVSIDGMCGVY
jgi:mycofactocin precursor